MNHLRNNLTFAVLVTDGGWRTDLTARFCEYYSQKINGTIDNIMIVDSVDQALEQCATEYLLIQSGGHLTFRDEFFETLNQCADEAQDIILGHIVVADDYMVLDPQCLFVNMLLWQKHGCIPFASKIKNGPIVKAIAETSDKFRPAQIQVDGTDRTFVPANCGLAGAGLIVTQLDTFNIATSLNFLDSTHFHLLDLQTSLTEIRSETIYEKKYLPEVKKEIRSLDEDVWVEIPDHTINITIAPARGLKALNLAEHYKSNLVVVYDTNELAIELQRRIFSVNAPTLYGDIVTQFMLDYPSARIIDDWTKDRHKVVTVFKGDVQYKLVDLFSYQIEDLVKHYDHTKSMIIDFSDSYTHPHNFYRRPLYQVQGLFAEVYSLLKSRTGPTHILGFAPGFQQLNSVKVNTDGSRFDLDASVVYELPEDVPEAPMFRPETSVKEIVEDEWTPPAFSGVVTEVKAVKENPFTLAIAMGYSEVQHLDAINNLPTSKIMLVKEETFDNFIAVFEYTIDDSGRWSFKIGVPNNPKRIEFSNGLSYEGFKKHLLNEMKINPTMASRYFLTN